jgi:hypothetical protein
MKKPFWISSVLLLALRLILPNTLPQRTHRKRHGQTNKIFGVKKWEMKSLSSWFFVAAIAFATLKVEAVPRIALMDFMSEDNSYRSTVALSDLVGAMQVEMTGDTNYEWVERAELEKAANEFKFAGFGFIDRSEAIRSGHWVKADFGIFGDVSTNLNGSRTLSLEVVNLERADVLAETNLSLSASGNTPFQMKIDYVSRFAAALRAVLNQAQQTYSNSQKQDAIAFLFLSRSGTGDGYDNLEDNFRGSLSVASANSQVFHLIQFQRAGVAMDEANLVLSGLAVNDSNSWKKVADHYVWGNAAVADRKYYDFKINQWQDEQKVDVTLNVWDGRSEPQVIILTVTNETSEAVAKQLEQAIKPLFHRDLTRPVAENVRSRISDSILERYTGLPVNFWFDSPEGRKQWFDSVQLLETACFFNPGNAAAREQLLRLRWGTALSGYNAESPTAGEELGRLALTQGITSASRNEFFFARRRSEAWGKYVEQFGFKSFLAPSNSPSIAAEYVLSAWRPFEMFDYSQENQAQWRVPRDAGLREITEWQEEFGSEFVSRLLKAPDQYNGTYLDTLKKYFSEIGQSGGEQILLAQVKADTSDKNGGQTNSPPLLQHFRLPRIAELESAQQGDIFSVPRMNFSPSLIEPEIQTISFPADIQVKSVKSMIFRDDALWLAVEIAEPLEIKTVNDKIGKDFQPVLVDHVRLWKLDARTQTLQPVGGRLATNIVNNMMFHGDTLWLALDDDGIAALNVKTGELRRYESSAGAELNVGNQSDTALGIPTIDGIFGFADTARGITAIGGMSDLLFLEDGSDMWKPFVPGLPHQNFSFGADLRRIAGLKDKLLLYNGQLLLCDLQSNTWTQIAGRAECNQIGRVNSITSDGNNYFWIAGDSGLHDVNPNTGQIRNQWVSISPTIQNVEYPGFLVEKQGHKSDSQLIKEIQQKLELRHQFLDAKKAASDRPDLFVPNSRLSASVLSVAADGDFLWVFTTDTTRPLLFYPANRSWVGGFSIRLKGSPSAMTCGGGNLWLATQSQQDFAVLKIDTSTLKSTLRERWVPDTISREQLSASIAGLPEEERAIYNFFAGEDADVIKLLQTKREDELDAQLLFLLVIASKESGQAESAEHFKSELNINFPQSVFTKALSLNDPNTK